MAQTVHQRLETLKKRNLENNSAINKDLYRLLVRKDFLITCYQNIKSKARNLTRGTDKVTKDRYPEKVIDLIIIALKDQSWQFKPVRKRNITKVYEKRRSLEVTDIEDKIIQKGIEMILLSIYDPLFSNSSHGFKIGRSCHSALRLVRTSWLGVKWVIEGHIEDYYDNVDHSILIRILRRKIQDERFINLIWKFLRSGYEQEGDLKPSKKGLPQGRISLRILTNIYLNELDIFIQTLINQYNFQKRRTNPNYKDGIEKPNYLSFSDRDNGKWKSQPRPNSKISLQEIRRLTKEMLKLPSKELIDENYKKIIYVRYTDDWILGIIGSKNFSETIHKRIQRFLLEHLKLTLSPEKNDILHFNRQGANFLGYAIKSQQAEIYSESSKSKDRFGGKKKILFCKPTLLVPMDLVIKGLSEKNFCTKLGFPLKKKGWIVYDDKVIIYRYNSVLQKLHDYYALAHNLRISMKRIHFILKYSCAHTLAAKHRTRISKQFTRTDSKSIKVLLNDIPAREVKSDVS
jgi:group II intron reverse transcriptase/maturase